MKKGGTHRRKDTSREMTTNELTTILTESIIASAPEINARIAGGDDETISADTLRKNVREVANGSASEEDLYNIAWFIEFIIDRNTPDLNLIEAALDDVFEATLG